MRVELAWVDALLGRWGRWSIRCESGALGFASSCILAGGGDGDAFDSAVPKGVMDGDMEAVDGAVRRLPGVMRVAVIQVYVHGHGWSDDRNAQALGVSRKILAKYVLDAHRKIALDISCQGNENSRQSVIGEISPERMEPAAA